jgi:hypothetical protein
MENLPTRKKSLPIIFSIAASAIALALATTAAAQAPAPANPGPYSVGVFATNPPGISAPDSITFNATNVFVGYGNGGMPDGSDNAKSNIVEYDMNGNSVRTFDIVGHNDGLRINPQTGDLWALQNEDGNATLIIIDLPSGRQTTYELGTGPHGGGYDDIVFDGNFVFLSASAPTINPNTAPAIVSLRINPFSRKTTLTGILNGDATVTSVSTGKPVTLNLQDPDSMILDPDGDLVMTSQGDGELIVVHHPGLSCQSAFVVPLTSTAGGDTIGDTQFDDTVFVSQARGKVLVADKQLGAVYVITAPYFAPGAAYSAVSIFSSPSAANPTESFVGQTDLTTGFVTPIISNMGNPGGEAFIPAEQISSRRARFPFGPFGQPPTDECP